MTSWRLCRWSRWTGNATALSHASIGFAVSLPGGSWPRVGQQPTRCWVTELLSAASFSKTQFLKNNFTWLYVFCTGTRKPGTGDLYAYVIAVHFGWTQQFLLGSLTWCFFVCVLHTFLPWNLTSNALEGYLGHLAPGTRKKVPPTLDIFCWTGWTNSS